MKEQTEMTLQPFERHAPWQGYDRWICGSWLILRVVGDVTIRYDGQNVARLMCDSEAHSTAVIDTLGALMPKAVHEHQLYHALGFTDAHGLSADFQTSTQRYARWQQWIKEIKA